MSYNSRRPHQVAYHSSPLQIEKRGYNLQELTKIGPLKTRKNVACSNESLSHLDGSEFGVKQNENMDPSCLDTTVQAGGGGVMVWVMFSWHTLGPLVPIGHCLNATAYLSIVSDHVHPFMATMYPIL